MHLYVLWGMLVLLSVNAWKRDSKVPGLDMAFFCFLLLFSSLSEFTYHGWIVGGQIKCVALIALLVVTLRYRFVAPDQPSVYAPA